MLKKNGDLFEDMPKSYSKEAFDTIVKTKGIKIERIVSSGQATPKGKWLKQKNNEWVIVLKGRAKLLFKDKGPVVELKPGDYVHIPAGCPHRVEWTAPRRKTVWLAMHY